MSKSEQNRINKQKEQNVLDELIPKAEQFKRNLEEKTGTSIFAQIQPVGRPMIGINWRCPLRKKWLESNKKFKGRNEEALRVIMKQFARFCEEGAGILPFAIIAQFGAKIDYTLTDKKAKEIGGVKPNEANSVR